MNAKATDTTADADPGKPKGQLEQEAKNLTPPEAQGVIAGIALLVYNTLCSKWLSDSDRTDTLSWTFGKLAACLEQTPELVVRLVGDRINCNGLPVGADSERLRIMIRQMKDLKTDNVAFKPGLTQRELEHYLEVFTAKPEDIEALGGFSSALVACEVEHITCKTVIFVEVSEDELVVQKKDHDASRDAAERVKDVEEELEQIAGIVAHLGGEAEAADTDARDALREMASDARRLAELIFEAAQRKKDTAEPGEGMLPRVIEAAQRAFESLQQDPAARTQKGSRETKQKIEALEHQLLAFVDAGDDITDPETCRQAIRKASETAAIEIERDALATEYMRRLRALEKTERRLMRHLSTAGDARSETDEIRGRLEDGGVASGHLDAAISRYEVDGARDNEARRGGEGRMGDADISTSIAALGSLLSSLRESVTELVKQDAVDRSGALSDQTQAVSQLVSETSADAEMKLQALSRDLETDAAVVASMEAAAREHGVELIMPRQKVLERLQEISQEICQPVAVIQSTVDIINQGSLGELNDSQHSIMQLAVESATRLSGLLDSLRHLVGSPESLEPDHDILRQMNPRD